MLAGHEAAPAILRVRDSRRIRIRHAVTQTRWSHSTAGHEYAGGSGASGQTDVCTRAVYVQDSDDEADATAVRAQRGGGDQVAECSAGADREENRRWGCPWRSEWKSGLEAGGWRGRCGARGRDGKWRAEA